MEKMPKSSTLQCPRNGCYSKVVYRAAPGVEKGFGSGPLPPALEEIWECVTCKQPFIFILIKSN